MTKVSVIIPTYNVQDYIDQCISSVLGQTFEDFELILVDDCSTDHTIDCINKYDDPRIKLLKNAQNSGPSHSRNRGINAASGTYIAFLDSDDWWSTDRLEKMISFAEEKSADMVCDDQHLIKDNHDTPWSTIFKNGKVEIDAPRKFDAAYFINQDLGLKPIIRKEILDTHKIRFNEGLRYGEDYLLFLECLVKGANAWLLPEAYYYYRAREGSLITYNLDLLQQTLSTTNDLLEQPTYQHGDVREALQNRKKRIKEAITYYSFTQPMKEGNMLKGILKLLQTPSGLWLIAKRSPRVIRNRILRPLQKNK